MAVSPAASASPANAPSPAVGPEVLAAALAASADGTALLDEDGRCVYVNPAACAILGVPADALLGWLSPSAEPQGVGKVARFGVSAG
jgi:PAS domain-containing protein